MERGLGTTVEQGLDHLLEAQNFAQPDFQRWEQELSNEALPIYERRHEIMQSLADNPITILVAETGAGKSTQAPLLALQLGFDSITITQPRRRAALNVADRLRFELGEKLSIPMADELVSVQTGAGRIGQRDARIKVVTDGLHLIRDGDKMDSQKSELWIIDEVHEANVNIELLLALGREKAARNPNFRMLVMSATMDKERLADYCTLPDGGRPPIIEVAGRMHEVEKREEAESDVAKEVIKAAQNIIDNPDDYEGAKTIQVFVAGKQEIKDTLDKLANTLPPHILQQAYMFGLHSKMPESAQAPAYEPVPGIKIIVQTKMGQTSMTIPGTRYVISSGQERRIELDDEGTPGLMLRGSTQDDLTQQAGRTGRTNPGIFILTRMDGKSNFISWASREQRPAPEIQRSELDRSTLFLAASGRDIGTFETLNTIAPISIERSHRRLRALSALDVDNSITAMGRRMNSYPASPSTAASMVAVEKSPLPVRNYMAAIAAIKEAGSLKYYERGGTTRWESLTHDITSDDLSELELFIAVQDMDEDQLRAHDIDSNNLIRAREQYRKIAKTAGADPDVKLGPPKAEEIEVVRQAILAGSLNNIYLPFGEGLYRHLGDSIVKREVSNRSVITGTQMPIVGTPRNVAIVRAGKPELKRIVEQSTEVSLHEIGRIATAFVKWEPTRFIMRNGSWMQEERQAVDIYSLGSREVPAEPSPLLRQAIIEHAKVSPGKHLKQLYEIKTTLEKLAHKAKEPVKQLSEDTINSLIDQATPESITDPSLIENNLRELMTDLELSLENFVTPARRERIARNAPPSIAAGTVSFGLRYARGKPIAKKWTVDKIADAPDDLALRDYRQVHFYYGHGLYTLPQLKKMLRDERLL
jgi:HrpA-like RNA helicase